MSVVKPVAAALTMRTVAAEYAIELPDGDVLIDFSDVTQADSAALALLIHWLRRAKANHAKVECRALPPVLTALADLYGVTGLLPPQSMAKQ
ncbi:MAG: STAS domain-containing protein [Azoarcus sp.]|nr:STAS domain-containing protein [Azoarcus sp.]